MRIKHEGNDCPVPIDTPVLAYLGDGTRMLAWAGDLHWGPAVDGEGRIAEYEVLVPVQ